jgi:hypothetical protein
MLDKNDKILSIVENINKTIDFLLEQGGTVIAPIAGEVPTKKQKFIVIADGEVNNTTEDEYYIELSVAKEYDSNVQVGDEIEIDVLDFDSSDDEGILSILSSDDISEEDLIQIAAGRRTTIRVGGRIIKYGPRTLRKLGRLGKKALDAKRYVSRYGKKAEHGVCYCLSFTKDGLDENGDMDKTVFISSIIDQPEFIQENLLNTWKYCVKKYKKELNKKDDRQETEKSCVFLDDWYKKSESLLDDMINTLKQAYEVRGYNKELDDETKKVGTNKSVSEKMASKDYIEIKFSTDTTIGMDGGSVGAAPPASPFFSSNDLKRFKIQKTFNERNNTVLLKKGSKYYVMGFETTQIGKPQTDQYFALYDASSSSIVSPKGNWSGKIMSYPN